MAENSMKPRIRFKGYTDAWEQRKVCCLANRFDNLRVPITATDRIAGRTPYYGANGIQDYVEGFTHDGEFILIAEDGANDLKNYPVQYVNGKIWVNNHAHVLQATAENSNMFLRYCISVAGIEALLVGGSRVKLSAETLMHMKLVVPQNEEQNRIGDLFSKWDNHITLHQRKYDKILNIKKALLEKMFPADAETTPKIRFRGFTDAWERRKLGEVANIQKGQQLGKTEMSSVGAYYVLNGGMEVSGYTNQYNAPANTITISEGGNSCGYVSLNLECFWSGGHNYTLQKLKVDTIFLYEWLKRNEMKIMALRVGSGLPNIQKSSLQEVGVACATIDEQQAIALILIKLDNLINLYRQQIEKLKNIKTALLEKTLV